jgi:predicted MPP superfamily phosphohydrolase
VSGHAHGGQFRLLGRGVYAPGQGLLPRYTRGVEDGRMIISAGAGNPARMPRWGNPCEVLMITLD